MRSMKFIQKLVIFSMIAMISTLSLSYACGMGDKAPFGGESGSAPSDQGSGK